MLTLLLRSTLLVGTALLAQAAPITFQVANLTASGGDPVYSVATDVTFTGLSLTTLFADTTSRATSLLDSGGASRSSLDTLTLALNSANVDSPDPVHGAITQATLTGTLSATSLSILTTPFGGTPTTATVLPNFNAILTNPGSGSSVNIFATAANGGATYAIGTFGTNAAAPPAAVPEPASFSLFAAPALILLWRSRRSTRC